MKTNNESQKETYNRVNILPLPFPDPKLWEFNLKAGFRMFPQRRENYFKCKNAKRQALLDYLPIRLDIENVSRCDYGCTMCQVSGWPKYKRAEDMSFEDYKNVIDSQFGLIEVKLQGMGEPLLGKCFFEMIEYARKKHIWVRSATNASLLHLRENYKKVLNTDICELQVSIDGTSKESYEKIRKGGRFERVKENCILLNSYGNQINQKRTRMWVVLQQDNFHELEEFPKLAAELGFDRLTLTLNLNDWGQEYWKEINEKVDVHKQFDLSKVDYLVELGRKLGVEVTFWSIDTKYNSLDLQNLCPTPFERLYISSDMRMVPCAGVANPEIVDLGNAKQLTEEWNGKKMVAFRETHLNGNIQPFCQKCYK